MRIFIEPTEPLLFRTGPPFNAGEDNFAESIFPPTPETLQGVLRSAIAVQWGQHFTPAMTDLSEIFQQRDLTNLIGDHQCYGRLRITGLTLGRCCKQSMKVERLFPPPAHITRVTLESEKRLVLLMPKLERTEITNLSGEYVLLYPKLDGQKTTEKSEDLKDWLTSRGLQEVLQGKVPSENHLVKIDQIYVRESRLGIGIDSDKRTTREGYLYQTQMVRMRHDGKFTYGFVIDFELGERGNGHREVQQPVSEQREDAQDQLSFLQEGWLTIGGEQRAARFKVLKPEEIVDDPGLEQKGTGNSAILRDTSLLWGRLVSKNSKRLTSQAHYRCSQSLPNNRRLGSYPVTLVGKAK